METPVVWETLIRPTETDCLDIVDRCPAELQGIVQLGCLSSTFSSQPLTVRGLFRPLPFFTPFITFFSVIFEVLEMAAGISSFGKKKLWAYLVLTVLDIIVIALAARVNIFQEFFFMADLFPLGLSIATLLALLSLMWLDLALGNPITSRPVCQISLLYILSIFWMAFNAFSTVRWGNIPLPCSSIPSEFPDERTWCQDVQVLKSFVWLLFVGLFITATFLLKYVLVQHYAGNKHVWKCSLTRFDPFALNDNGLRARHETQMTTTDYFASGNEFARMPNEKTSW